MHTGPNSSFTRVTPDKGFPLQTFPVHGPVSALFPRPWPPPHPSSLAVGWKLLLGLGEWATRAISLNKLASVVCGFIIKFPRERRAEGRERGGSRGREGTARGRWILGTSQLGGVPQASIETTCGIQGEVQDCSAKEESFQGLLGHLAGKNEVGPSQPHGLLPSPPWSPSSKPLEAPPAVVPPTHCREEAQPPRAGPGWPNPAVLPPCSVQSGPTSFMAPKAINSR